MLVDVVAVGSPGTEGQFGGDGVAFGHSHQQPGQVQHGTGPNPTLSECAVSRAAIEMCMSLSRVVPPDTAVNAAANAGYSGHHLQDHLGQVHSGQHPGGAPWQVDQARRLVQGVVLADMQPPFGFDAHAVTVRRVTADAEVSYLWHESPVAGHLKIAKVHGFLICPVTGRALVSRARGHL